MGERLCSISKRKSILRGDAAGGGGGGGSSIFFLGGGVVLY